MSEYRVIVTDQVQSVLAGHDGVSYESPPHPHDHALELVRALTGWSTLPTSAARGAKPARRHANRPNRASTMTVPRLREPPARKPWTCTCESSLAPRLARGCSRSDSRFATGTWAACSSPPTARLAPPDLSNDSPREPMCTSGCACAAAAAAVARRSTARASRSSRSTRRTHSTDSALPSIRRLHDRVLGHARARARILRPVRGDHGAAARASQPPPRARSRRRPRLGRRRPNSASLICRANGQR